MSDQSRTYSVAIKDTKPKTMVESFLQLFETEEKCVKELFKLAEIDNTSCQHCQSKNIQQLPGGRSAYCFTCSQKTWFTAGTALHHMKKAKPRLAVIWLAQRGQLLSSSQLAKIFEISQSSAYEIRLWFSQIISAQLLEVASESIHSAQFMGAICKRSLETPARSHPNTEIEEEQRKADKYTSEEKLGQQVLVEIEEKTDKNFAAESTTDSELANSEGVPLLLQDRVLKHISHEPISFDSLAEKFLDIGPLSAVLMLLELDGKIEAVGGSQFVLAKCFELPEHTTNNRFREISNFLHFVISNFHGISRKYLQLYVAIFWYTTERDSNKKHLFLKTALKEKLEQPLRQYISPLFVTFPAECMDIC